VARDVVGQIHQEAFELRAKMEDGSREEQDRIINALLDQLFDLAAVRRTA
jgi:hypothetical protein